MAVQQIVTNQDASYGVVCTYRVDSPVDYTDVSLPNGTVFYDESLKRPLYKNLTGDIIDSFEEGAEPVLGKHFYVGTYDASTNTFPTVGGSGVSGSILKGDVFIIDTEGILGGMRTIVSSEIRALVDNPTLPTEWHITEAKEAPLDEPNLDSSSIDRNASQQSVYAFNKAGTALNARLDFFNNTAGDLAENFREYTTTINERVRPVSALDGYVYLFSLNLQRVYIFNPNTLEVVQEITTGITANIFYQGMYNPLTNSIYFSTNTVSNFTLYIFDIETRSFYTYQTSEAIGVYGKGANSLDFRHIYMYSRTTGDVIKLDVLAIRDSSTAISHTIIGTPLTSENGLSLSMGRNGCIYVAPWIGDVWVKIDTLNNDTVTTIPHPTSANGSRSYLTKSRTTYDGKYIVVFYERSTSASVSTTDNAGVWYLNTDDDTFQYQPFPSLLNYNGNFPISNETIGADGNFYAVTRGGSNTDYRGFIISQDPTVAIQEVLNIPNEGYILSTTSLNGLGIYFPYNAPLNRVMVSYPVGDSNLDMNKIILIQ